MPPLAATMTAIIRRPAGRASAQELLRFSLVGASGYVVNLAIYSALIHAGLSYLPAAASSFAVAVVNNYRWNHRWTFRSRRGSLCHQGLRFLAVSLCSLVANLLVLHALVGVGTGQLAAQALAIALVTPLSFLGSKLWAFARRRPAQGW